MIGETLEASQPIRRVAGGTFERLVMMGQGPIVVEFMSYGCAHCRAIEPALKHVANVLASKQQVFRVNVAVEGELADSYEILATPTFIMFLDAKEVGRVEGPRPTVASLLAAMTQPFTS